jgi:putative transposase
MFRDYTQVIKESPNELRNLQDKHRNTLIAPRMRLLFLLKSGEVRTLRQASELIQYSRMQCHRWMKAYQEEGLKALRKQPRRGAPERMTVTALMRLKKALARGELASYKQARAFLAQEGVVYKHDSSVSKLLKRHSINVKPASSHDEQEDVELSEAFTGASVST